MLLLMLVFLFYFIKNLPLILALGFIIVVFNIYMSDPMPFFIIFAVVALVYRFFFKNKNVNKRNGE